MKVCVCFLAIQLFAFAFFVAVVCLEAVVFFVGARGDHQCVCYGVEHRVSFRSVDPLIAALHSLCEFVIFLI